MGAKAGLGAISELCQPIFKSLLMRRFNGAKSNSHSRTKQPKTLRSPVTDVTCLSDSTSTTSARAANGRRIARCVSTFIIKSMDLFLQRLCQIAANVSFFYICGSLSLSPPFTSRHTANNKALG